MLSAVQKKIGIVVSLAAILACSSDSPVGPGPDPVPISVSAVTLDRDSATIVPGASVKLTATATGSGQTLNRTITWTSSDNTKATVGTDGTVTASAPGSVSITATSEGISARATITILDGGLITSSGGTVHAAGNIVTLVAPANAVTTNTSVVVQQATSPPASEGLIAGTAYSLAPASTTFAQAASLTIKYSPPALGQVLRSTLALYILNNGAWQLVAGSSVDSANAAVTAPVTKLGTFAIIGIIPPPPVASVTLSRDTATILRGATVKLTATAKSSDGQILDRPVTWSSSDQSKASVASDGTVTGVAAGSAVITATVEGKSATATITVFVPPAAVASITLDVTSLALYSGLTRAATPTVRDADGNVLSGRTISWTSSNSSVASVTSAGAITSGAFGTAIVTASVEGKSATVSVSVKHDPIIFVHGFASSGQIWGTMINSLVADGWLVSDMTNWSYDTTISNATIAGLIKLKVDSITSVTGAPRVDIISHSMGGLSSRYYARNLGGSDKIDAWVSLGGPNHGTTTASLCGLISCVEMQPGSAFLTALNSGDETPGSPRYATWWTPCDNVTTPPESVILSGATNTQTACIGHSDLYRDATVYGQVRDWIR